MTLRIIDLPEGNWSASQVGDMWRCDSHPDEAGCWIIRLPSTTGAVVLWHTKQEATGGGSWNVQGDPPNITVTPSIKAGDEWHGHITNGEFVGA